ncbi:MAG: amino acid permease [Calditrichaeota bacterium]|nr:MAG: amino acid permease [Calditrichota bacterium]
MALLDKSKRLKKELSLFNIYTIATGATIASGFFLLPGIAYSAAGPAVVFSYFLAALPVVPALFSKAELSTAMPRAGGVYYFLDRSMGPLFGTIGGIGTWLALVLKTAFALVGMGVYVEVFFPHLPLLPLSIAFAVLFGAINLFGAKKTGLFQSILVIGLLTLLVWFVSAGLPRVQLPRFSGFFDRGMDAILATAGLVYISYMGLTKIASVSEEVRNPEKSIPLAMFLALLTALLIYVLGTFVIVGVMPGEELARSLTPVASAAEYIVGHIGAIIMTTAAILAFFSVANAGILSASRYPLAMARDHLFPRFFRVLSRRYRSPIISIFVTVGMVVLCLVLFNPTKIAKLASSFQLLLFALNCLAVIVMRESQIASYDPGYRSPLYPWMQIVGFFLPLWFIFEMGWLPMLFTLGLIGVGTAWYFGYARNRVARGGAIYHIFARLGERRFEGLDQELRGILKEKGLREEDPFDALVATASIIDVHEPTTFEKVVGRAAARFAQRFSLNMETLVEGFLQGTRVGATPVSRGVALPHLRLPDIDHPEMVMVRCYEGVRVDIHDEFVGKERTTDPVYAFFFLISPEENPGQHLRILAQIAGLTDGRGFIKKWLSAKNEQEVKELLLRDDRYLSLVLRQNQPTRELIGCPIKEMHLPEGCLIALVRRGDRIVVPRGDTVLEEGDRLTIIGYPKGIQELMEKYRNTR